MAEHIGPEIQIYSNSGGTDVCTPFVMSAPNVPVWVGEIRPGRDTLTFREVTIDEARSLATRADYATDATHYAATPTDSASFVDDHYTAAPEQ